MIKKDGNISIKLNSRNDNLLIFIEFFNFLV